MSDEYNANKDPQLKKKEFTEQYGEKQTSQQIYDKGLKKFLASGYKFVRDLYGPYAGHRVYVESRPAPIAGINYPPEFRVWTPLSDPNDLEMLQSLVLDDWDEMFVQFWFPLVEADVTRRKPIFGHVAMLMNADSEARKNDSGAPFELGISWDSAAMSGAISWIPRKEWFSSKLHKVTMRDVFTIFPEAELSLLELIVGRIVVGRTNNLPVGAAKPIRHTARMCGVIVGLDPGTGKSTLMNFLTDALGRVGYRHSTFRNLSDRFNLGSVIGSHLAIKDDVTAESFRNFIRSEAAKIIVTNGEMRVEEKGVNATDQYAHTVLLLNSNSYDPRTVFDIDPGTADRIKLLSTLSESEIRSQELTGVSEGSPNCKPFTHLPWLAEKLGVSIDALMLWVCRLAADRFMEVISDNSNPNENPLEVAVRQGTNRLKRTLSKDTTKQVLCALVFLASLRSDPWPNGRWSPFTEMDWVAIFQAAQDVYRVLPVEFKRDLGRAWEDKGLPNLHPFPGLRALNWSTLTQAASRLHEAKRPELSEPLGKVVQAGFSAIHLKSGFKFPSDLVWLIAEWEALEPLKDELQETQMWFLSHIRLNGGSHVYGLITGTEDRNDDY